MSNVGKGTRWVRKIQDTLEARGLIVSRRQWMDAGDDMQVMSHRLSIEAKNVRAYRLGDWVDQAVRQSPGHLVPVVWAHRNGHADPLDGFVIMTGAHFLELLTGVTEEAFR